MDSMYRLDAIYPELRENDNAFVSLIAIVWLFLVDKRMHPADTSGLIPTFGTLGFELR